MMQRSTACACGGGCPRCAPLQAKLEIGQPGDKYEQEADRIANQVMRMPDDAIQPTPLADHISPLVQRQIDGEEDEEEPIQAKLESPLQRQAEGEEEETIQAKGDSPSTSIATPMRQTNINTLIGGGHPLPDSVRKFFEPRFGYDFSGVRIHTGNRASEVARSINAQAFTKGTDIVFGSGQYKPGSCSGDRLLAHELTHVVQQGNPAQSQPGEYSQAKTEANKRTTPIISSGTSESIIRRAVSCTTAKKVHGKPNEVGISTIEGSTRTNYVVIRSFEISEKPVTKWKYPDPSARFGWDKNNIWIEIDWCKNTKGSIQIGSAVPSAIRQMFQNLLGQISSGKLDMNKSLKQANFQHFIKIMLRLKSGWKISAMLYTDIKGGSEYSGAGAGGCVEWGPFTGCIKGGHEKGFGWNVQGTLSVTWVNVPEGFKCPKEKKQTSKLVITPKYTCKQYIPAGTKKITSLESDIDTKSFYIYYPYIRHEKKSIDTKRSQILELTEALQKGYKVVSITGHASPEGPIKRETRTFMGNEALAQKRADTAKEFVKDICLSVGCAGDINAIVPEGKKELYTKWVNGKEAKGQEQGKEAIDKFLIKEEERRHWKDPDFIKKLRIAQRRGRFSKPLIEKVYHHLRRAVITLRKETDKTVTTTVKTEAFWKTLDSCPNNCILSDAKKLLEKMDKE